jgi:hypothetical protein
MMLVQAAATLAVKRLAPPENLFILVVETALGGLAALPIIWLVVLESGERRLLLDKLRLGGNGRKLGGHAP